MMGAFKDIYLVSGILMLLIWGGLTIGTEAPGAVHLLLTAGVFVIVWRIVVRGTPAGPVQSGHATTASNSVSQHRRKR